MTALDRGGPEEPRWWRSGFVAGQSVSLHWGPECLDPGQPGPARQ